MKGEVAKQVLERQVFILYSSFAQTRDMVQPVQCQFWSILRLRTKRPRLSEVRKSSCPSLTVFRHSGFQGGSCGDFAK